MTNSISTSSRTQCLHLTTTQLYRLRLASLHGQRKLTSHKTRLLLEVGQTARQRGSSSRQSMWGTSTRASSTLDSMGTVSRLWRMRRKCSISRLWNLTVEYETLKTQVQTGLHRVPHSYVHSRIRAITTLSAHLSVPSRSKSHLIREMVVEKLSQLDHVEESKQLLVADQSALQTSTSNLTLQRTTLTKME